MRGAATRCRCRCCKIWRRRDQLQCCFCAGGAGQRSNMAMAAAMLACLQALLMVSSVAHVAGARQLPALASAAAAPETEPTVPSGPPYPLRRSHFPKSFVFGTSSASYQYEGAVNEGGRGPCIWDSASHMPGVIHDNTTGDVANDHYHRYQEDIGFMVDLGVDTYRFSIAWPRIFPDGSGSTVNEEGIAFYNRLIDTLLAKGIQPFVALSHHDLPQPLQDAFGGWRSRQIVPLFAKYAETCFAAFGDRVKYWITINEIHKFAIKYTNIGCKISSSLCGAENNNTWAYTTGHHMLLSHAAAVDVYRTRFQAKQGGKIGLIADAQWYEPISDSPADIEAVDRLQAFQVQWVLDPIYFGEYPEVVRTRVGDRLPSFTESEARSVKGSVDFLGINHYTTHYAADQPNSSIPRFVDPGAASVSSRDGVLIGPTAGSSWLNIVPYGIHRMLNYIRVRYNNPVVYITENGVDEDNDPTVPLEVVLRDAYRIQYHNDYLAYVVAAIRDGCDVRGYFVWSLLDNFEWDDGLSKRFGLYYVDYAHNLTRHPKDSAKWFKQFLRHTLRSEHPDI